MDTYSSSINQPMTDFELSMKSQVKDIRSLVSRHGAKVPSTFTLLGKSMPEPLIFASTNPQYDNRLSIELPGQYMKISWGQHGKNMRKAVYKNCSECQKQFL